MTKILDSIVSFRTVNPIAKIIELEAKKRGLSKSEFLSINSLDTAMNFERIRHIDTLSDFLDVIALPFIMTQGIDKETANNLIKALKTLQTNYVKERLDPKLKLQKHLTNIALRSYLQDYNEDWEGPEGFIIQQCLKTIYDQLLSKDLIPFEEWEEKTQTYNLYMDEYGKKLI
jgi:hypothetical protein